MLASAETNGKKSWEIHRQIQWAQYIVTLANSSFLAIEENLAGIYMQH